MASITASVTTTLGTTYTGTVNYSVSSTSTQTTLTVDSYSFTASSGNTSGIELVADGTTVLYVGNKTDGAQHWGDDMRTKTQTTKTWNRSTSAQSKTIVLKIYEFQVSNGYSSKVKTGQLDGSVSVPALASYTVTYKNNGHGTAPSNQTKYYGQSLTLRSAISATGFTFVRWNTKSDNTGTGYNGGASYTGNAALTLYAIWNHSVAYNANGGSGAPSTQTALATSAITLSSTKPTRTGYTFKNWNTKADGTGTTYNPSGTLAAAAAGVTLYAQWTIITYTVSYNANGHGTKPSNQTKTYGVALTLADAISATGFTFVRWNTKSDNTGTGYNAKASYTGNAALALYAIWNHSVAYNANGGSGAPSTQTALATSAITLSSTTPTRTGYTFKNWNTKADGTGTTYNPSGTLAAAAAGVTLYAQWTIITYTVSYNANGHGTKPSNQTKTYGVALTLADAISATGFTFVRWNTKSDNTGTGYNAKASYTGNAALTLYAIWNHSVAYNANGGSGAPSTQTALATSAITLSSTKPTRTGYRFVKWNTNSSGTGTDYNPSGSFAAGTAGVTLYAQWEKIIQAVSIGTIKAIRTEDATSTAEADEGTYAYVEVPATVTGMAAANVSMTATVVADSGDAPTITLVDASGTKAADASFTKTFKFRASGCNVDIRYTFTVTVTANNTTVTQTAVTASKSVVLASAFFTIDVKAGGKGIHFGGAATQDGFYVSMPARFNSYLIKCINADDLSVTPSENFYSAAFYAVDKNGTPYGGLHVAHLTSDTHYIAMECEKTIGGTRILNYLRLRIASDGTRSVVVSESAPWRTALGAVYTGGDTMTGDLAINKATPTFTLKGTGSTRIDAAAITSAVYAGRIHFRDSNNDVAHYIETGRNTSNETWSSFIHRRTKADGSSYTNHGFYLYIQNDGGVSVGFPSTTSRDAWATGLNVVKKAGDTMTGNLTISKPNAQLYCKSTDLDSAVGQTIPSSGETMFGGIQFQDKQGYNMGWFRQYKNPSDKTYTQMLVRRHVGSSDIVNGLTLIINADGTRAVSVSDSAIWRSALGLAADSSWTIVSPVIAKKQGNVVTVSSNGNHSSAISANTWTDIATLPSGYRPSSTVYSAGMLRSTYACVVRINSSGVVAVYSVNASAASGSFRFSLSFVI